MNKKELIAAVAHEAGVDATTSTATVNATIMAITDALSAGEKVVIAGFGTFEPRQRAARTGRNPQTGESLEIAASTTVAFKPASGLKQALAK